MSYDDASDNEEHSLLGRGKQSEQFRPFTAFLFLVGYTIGSGFLVQAYVFKEAGIVVATFEYLVAVGFSYYGCQILLDIMNHRNIFHFARVAEDVLGSWGFYGVNALIITSTMGCMISYFIILGDILQTILTSYVGDSSSWYTDLFFLNSCITITMLPFCFFKEFPEMTFLCYLTITCVFIAIVFIVVDSLMNASNSSEINYASTEGTIATAGYLLLALGMTVTVPSTYKRLEAPAKLNFNSLVLYAQLLVGVLLFIEGLIGYLSFRSSTDVNILDNFSGISGTVFKCIVFVHLVSYMPGWIVIMRNAFCEVLHVADVQESYTGLLLVTVSTVIGLGFVSALLSEYYGSSTALSAVINITGGVSTSFLSFLFPALLGLNSGMDMMWYQTSLCWCMILLTIIVAVAVIYSAVL